MNRKIVLDSLATKYKVFVGMPNQGIFQKDEINRINLKIVKRSNIAKPISL